MTTKQLPQCPYVIRNASFDCGRLAKRGMDAADTVLSLIRGAAAQKPIEIDYGK